MKMVRLLTRKSIWAWLPPSCTSWWHGQTFSSPCACVCAFRLPHALRIGRQFSGSSGISNAHSNLEFGILILFARSYCAGFLVELQNQGWRFVSGLASKALGRLSLICPQNRWQWFFRFDLKIGGDDFSRFDFKTGDNGFSGLCLKTGSYGLVIMASKSLQ
jgi:hypothetical protein